MDTPTRLALFMALFSDGGLAFKVSCHGLDPKHTKFSSLNRLQLSEMIIRNW